MFNAVATADNPGYLLLPGADILLSERAIVSALRTFSGPVIGMSNQREGLNRFFDEVLRADYNNDEAAPDCIGSTGFGDQPLGMGDPVAAGRPRPPASVVDLSPSPPIAANCSRLRL